jgi:hypothetical protein
LGGIRWWTACRRTIPHHTEIEREVAHIYEIVFSPRTNLS